MSLARRSIVSASWNTLGSLLTAALLFGRSVMLARLLPVEAFGIYTFASSWVVLSLVLANFGMGDAFMHRAPESADEGEAAATHFTLKTLALLLWAALMIGAAWGLTEGATRLALLVLVGVRGMGELAQTARLILIRRVVHRRLALQTAVDALCSTAVGVALALGGAELWALLATDIASTLVALGMMYVWRPVWRPRWRWQPAANRYFLRFGSQSFGATLLQQLLDRVDDLWIGSLLGRQALGLYSRAYTFAGYPSDILARPLTLVASGTYAELKGDRTRLSKAFFRTNALVTRSSFLLAGIFWLVAPEFIRLFPGPKWLPMLDTLRLMLIYTLLDPIKGTVAQLFVAMGQPQRIVRARLVQLGVLIVALLTLGPRWGIVGAALAVDGMLVVGMGLLFWQARQLVDFSLRRLFAAPILALTAGVAVTLVASTRLDWASEWGNAALKGSLFTLAYATTLVAMERNELREMRQLVQGALQQRGIRHP